MIRRGDLLERMRSRATFPKGQAEAAITATLDALGAGLMQSERRNLAEALAPDLGATVLTAHAPKGAIDLESFYRRVQRHESVRAGRAREHAQIVCRALVEILPSEHLQLLRRHLPWLESLLGDEPPADAVLTRPGRRAPS